MENLTRTEAEARAALIGVRSYDVELDLTTGAQMFRSTTRIAFDCRSPGGATFVELTGRTIESLELNGRPLDPETAWSASRISLSDLAAENELVVVAECEYSSTGEGLHRFTDPADGEVYTYSQSFPYDMHRVFACFDQPDLKATLALRVSARAGWTVLANAPGREMEPGRWAFDPTPPLATYFVVLAAGPFHVRTGDHDGIPLSFACRRSLAPHLDRDLDELFEFTRQSFDYYHGLFEVRYPFVKYDQVFVPEFNAGAMENPGCVTIADEYVFRSAVTDDERAIRAEIITHEMAHMWFGDLVTMRWWDDVWLNESFAEYMAHLTLAEATRFRDSWTKFASERKPWGYRQDELPTTHPISDDVPDTASATLNLDGISYAKGAAVLKQLVAWVGFEPFTRGLRDYFAEHAWGNTTLVDLLRALERTSGRDLGPWMTEWIETAGVSTLRPDVTIADGHYQDVAIEQLAPPDHPVLRRHRVALGAYDPADGADGKGPLTRTRRLELDVVGPRSEVPPLAGKRVATLLVPNDDDLTWARMRFDEVSRSAILDGAIGRVDSSLTRAILWTAAWDMTREAEMSTGDLLRIALDAAPNESDIGLLRDLLARVRRAVDEYGDPGQRDTRLRTLADWSLAHARDASPGSDLQLAHARIYARSAIDPSHVELARGWLEGRYVPDGLAIDPELRWMIVGRLATIGAMDAGEIDAEHERDHTSLGEEASTTARTSLPSSAAKATAWHSLVESTELSSHLVAATARGFWRPEQVELGRPYVERYFEAMPAIFRARSQQVAHELAELLYPLVVTEQGTVDETDRLLARDDLEPSLRRILRERRDDLLRALAARQVDAAAGVSAG
ncbi:MAG: aminopeptidase N [Chloroflexota bacterium]